MGKDNRPEERPLHRPGGVTHSQGMVAIEPREDFQQSFYPRETLVVLADGLGKWVHAWEFRSRPSVYCAETLRERNADGSA